MFNWSQERLNLARQNILKINKAKFGCVRKSLIRRVALLHQRHMYAIRTSYIRQISNDKMKSNDYRELSSFGSIMKSALSHSVDYCLGLD